MKKVKFHFFVIQAFKEMIIKDLQPKNKAKEAKHKIYNFLQQVTTVFITDRVSMRKILLLYGLVMLPFVSILFKYEDPFPSAVSKVLRMFLFTSLKSSLSIDSFLVTSLIFLWMAALLALTSAHFVFGSVFSAVTVVLSAMLKTTTFLLVPLTDYAIYLCLSLSSAGVPLEERIFNGVTLTLMLCGVAVDLLFEFFSIRLLRKKTPFWNVQNANFYYGLLFQIYKTAVVSLQYDLATWCGIGLLIWYHHRDCQKGIVGKYEASSEFAIFDLIAAADAAVLISLVTGNRHQAFSFWLVFLAAAVGKALIADYHSRNDTLFLPTCDSAPQEFYDFYYRYKGRFNGDEEAWNQKTRDKGSKAYHLHAFWCPKPCKIKEFLSEDCKKPLQEIVGCILEEKKTKNAQNRIFYELWNLELGKKVDVKVLAQKPNITVSQDYVLYCIQKISKNSEVSIRASDENSELKKKAFYDILSEASDHYQEFYSQLGQNNPVIDVLVRQGVAAHDSLVKLRQIYAELLKLKLLSFRMAEFYIQFMKKFVGDEQAMDTQDAAKLLQLQKSHSVEDISQNPLPTFLVNPQSGYFEDVNAEGAKFLQLSRFELKSMSIESVTEPSILLQEVQKMSEKGDATAEPFHAFFKKCEGQRSFCSFTVEKKVIRQKKVWMLEVRQEKYSTLKNYFLLDEKHSLEKSLKETVKIKSHQYFSKPLILRWKDLFQECILSNAQKVLASNMVRLETSHQDCSLVVKKKRSLGGYLCLQAQIFVSDELSTRQNLQRVSRESVARPRDSRTHKSRFATELHQFHYIDAQTSKQKTQLACLNRNSELLKGSERKRNVSQIQRQLQSSLVTSILENSEDNCLSKNIRTYRLFQGELYNVDLEDKEAYNQQFQIHVPKEPEEPARHSASFQKNIVFGVVFLTFALIGVSIYSLIVFQGTTHFMTDFQVKHKQTHNLILDVNRLMAILKDYSSGFDSTIPNYSVRQELMISYDRIQALKASPIFTDRTYNLSLQSTEYRGTNFELIDLMLSQVTQLLDSGDLSKVQDIHNIYININDNIEFGQQVIHQSFVEEFNSLSKIKSILLSLSIFIVTAFFFLMLLYCYLSHQQIKKQLAILMHTNDSQTNIWKDNAQKIKVAVDMLRKNIEIDTQTLLAPVPPLKKRKQPKEATLNRHVIVIIVIVSLLGMGLHFTNSIFFSKEFDRQYSSFQEMLHHEETMFDVYRQPVFIAIQASHTGTIPAVPLDDMKAKMKQLTYSLNKFNFSPELNAIIKTIFLQNSCSILQRRLNLSQSQCSSTTPYFTIGNPFELGLLYYFTRQNYFIHNNLTEIFSHTSVYSDVFVRLYNDLMEEMGIQISTAISQTQNFIDIMTICIIVIDVGYLLAFFALYFYFQWQTQSVKNILHLFQGQLKSIRKDSREEEQEREPTQEASMTDSEDEIVEKQTQQQSQPRQRVRKKTTIHYDLLQTP